MKELVLIVFSFLLINNGFVLQAECQLLSGLESEGLGALAAVANLIQCGAIIEAGGTQVPPQVFECDYDCRTNHNSSIGTCDNTNYQCICSGPKNTTNDCTYFNEYFHTTFGCQCAHTPSAPIYGLIPYKEACEQDCACNHGARTGICAYDIKQCICDYDDFVYSNSTTNCKGQGYYNVTKTILDASKSIVDVLYI